MAAEFKHNEYGRYSRKQIQNAIDFHRDMFDDAVESRGISPSFVRKKGDSIVIKATYEHDEGMELPPGISHAVQQIYPEALPRKVQYVSISDTEAAVGFRLDTPEDEESCNVGVAQEDLRDYGIVCGERDEDQKEFSINSVPLPVYEVYAEHTKRINSWGEDEDYFLPPEKSDIFGLAISNAVLFDFTTPRVQVDIIDELLSVDEEDSIPIIHLPPITPEIIGEFTELAVDLVDRPGTLVSVYIEDPSQEGD